MRHIPARREQTQLPIPSHNSIGTLRAAKLAAQECLADARRKLSIAQSEFQKANKAERVSILVFVEASENAMAVHYG